MTTPDFPDFRALAQELLDAYVWFIEEYETGPAEKDTLVLRVRTALATPPPKPPTDEDLWAFWNNHDGPIPAILRAALERWGHR